jgi:hypothetical protein
MLTTLPSAMNSLRSELRVEDGPNGATSKGNLDSRFSTLHSKAIAADGRGNDNNSANSGVLNPE